MNEAQEGPLELMAKITALAGGNIDVPTPTTKKAKDELERSMKNTRVVREGNTIQVPKGMALGTAVVALLTQIQDQQREIEITSSFDFPVPEGVNAFMKVLKREHGFVSATGSPGFFGDGAPQFTTFETAPDVTESIPFNAWVKVPGIDGHVMASFEGKSETVVFRMNARIKGHSRDEYDRLVEMIREEVKTNSIYRGNAIICDFREIDSGSRNINDYFPKFWRVNPTFDPEALIFNQETQELIETAIWTPIVHTGLCRKQRIPLKRGVLLEGPYGTGKTLTAEATAKLGTHNGWTFIYLTDITKLARAVAFARNYQPAIIFAEDGDQVLSADRTAGDSAAMDLNDILNTIDGIESKNTEVMVVLTTNHVEDIDPAMLRPGRLDTVISVRPPDAQTAARLVRHFAQGQMNENEDLTTAGEALAGQIPAAIREAVERAKLGAIRRSAASGKDEQLNGHDVVIAARTMQAHLELLKPQEEDERSDVEKAAAVIAEGVAGVLREKATQTNGKPNGSKPYLPAPSEVPQAGDA